MRPATVGRLRRHMARGGLGVLLAGLLVAGTPAGWAAWTSTSASAAIRAVQAATLVSTSPVATQVAGGPTVAVSWSASTFATSYEVRAYASPTGGTASVVCTTSSTTCVDATSSGGTVHYSIAARVGTSWFSESSRTTFVRDVTTTVALTALGDDSGTSSTDYVTNVASTTLSGTAEAGATVVVKRDGATVSTTTASASGVWTTGTITLSAGTQTLSATATDAYGNTASAQQVVTLDQVAPTVTQSAPCSTPGNAAASGTWCKVANLSVTASATDAGSGLAPGTLEYQDDGGAWTSYSGALTLPQQAGRTVVVRARDVAGNLGATTATYFVDGTAPTLTVTSPANGASLTLAVLGSACGGSAAACGTSTDAVSGLPSIASIGWKLQRAAPALGSPTCYAAGGGTTSCTGYAFQPATGTLPAWATAAITYTITSSYTLTVQATDAAGNVATTTVLYSTLL